jgi:hypothetical protein
MNKEMNDLRTNKHQERNQNKLVICIVIALEMYLMLMSTAFCTDITCTIAWRKFFCNWFFSKYTIRAYARHLTLYPLIFAATSTMAIRKSFHFITEKATMSLNHGNHFINRIILLMTVWMNFILIKQKTLLTYSKQWWLSVFLTRSSFSYTPKLT